MKVVIDTNVIFSALYEPSSSPGRLLLLAIDEEVDLYAPVTVRAELERALRDKLGYSEEEWASTLAALPVEWVEAEVYASRMPTALRAFADPTDAPLVALALAMGIGVISGDRDFHPLRRKVVKTWMPKDFAGHRKTVRRTSRRGRRRR